MRIVEVNTVCDTGSTGRIAAGVARIAMGKGHEVYFAYGRGTHPSDICGYKISNKFDFLCHVLRNFIRGKNGFGSKKVTERFIRWLDAIQPDMLHLHNLHGFYLHVGMLFEYIKNNNIPVVWTLHDCWPFTGQCAHFDYVGCDRWKTGCYDCPIYRSDYPYSLFCDNSKKNYIDKKEIFTDVNNITIVSPSMWLDDLVSQSFLKHYRHIVINNGIDLEKFRIIKEGEMQYGELANMKSSCGISYNEKVILGVANVWTKKKGLDSFIELSHILPFGNVIVLIGIKQSELRHYVTLHNKNSIGSETIRIICIPHTESIEELVRWYNIANVFVNPTLEDNFPTTNIESLACGTPVITYNTGGSPEIIDDVCGKTIEKEDCQALMTAILSFLNTNEVFLADKCRRRAMLYRDGDRLKQYVNIIEEIK